MDKLYYNLLSFDSILIHFSFKTNYSLSYCEKQVGSWFLRRLCADQIGHMLAKNGKI